MALPNEALGTLGRGRLLSLGLVSKRWRNVTINTPNLWCGVQVGMGGLGSYAKIAGWYERGGDIPKTLVVVDDWEHGVCAGEDRCPMHSPTLLKLVAEGPALRRLSFYGVSAQCFGRLSASLCAQIPSNLASLPSLELTFRGSRWWHENDHPLAGSMQPFGSALTSLSISLPWQDDCSNPGYDAAQLAFAVPPRLLNNLTSLTVSSDWKLDHLTSTLQHCTGLERLEVDCCSAFTLTDADALTKPTNWQSGDGVVQLPKLHIMRLIGQHPQIVLLRHLITPSLHTLDLSFDVPGLYRRLYAGSGWCGYTPEDEEDPWDVAAERLAADALLLAQPLLPFLRRSGCLPTLRSLRLAGRELPASELLLTLGELPSLTQLALERVATNYKALWSSLEVPGLQQLRLDCVTMSSKELKALVKFLRRRPTTNLIHLFASSFKTYSEDLGKLPLTMSDTSSWFREQAVLASIIPEQLRDGDADEDLDKPPPRPPLVYGSLFD